MVQRFRALVATASSMLIMCAPALAAGEGRAFGARDPVTCSSTAAPTSGGPSAAQAARYVTCDREKLLGGQLYLITNLRIAVGPPRPLQYGVDNAYEYAPNMPVYPIRGSLRAYHCDPVSSIMGNAGKNCAYVDEPNAQGICYRTSFGGWRCAMRDPLHTMNTAVNVPPPA
jgi:hypothetical protein